MVKTKDIKRVPKLRFSEFEDEWGLQNLEYLCTKISDGIHSTPKYSDNGEFYFINGNNLIDGKVEVDDKTKRVDASEYLKHKREIGDSTILMSINGTIGKLAFYNNEKVVLGKSACYINLKEIADKIFIFNTLQLESTQYFFTSELTGSTIKNLSLKTIKNIAINIPTFPEQEKIASFLSAVDKKVQQLTARKELLEQYKKGLMQRIFSQEIRFTDENGENYPDWQEKPLWKICEIVGGGTPETSKPEYWNGKIPWFTPTEIQSKYIAESKRTISKLGLKNSSARLLPAGTILFTSRATVAEASFAMKECTTNQGFQSIIVDARNDAEFVYYLIKQNKKEFIRKAQGSTFLEISKNEMEKIKVLVPALLEQKEIGLFLSQIDQRIESVQSQLTQTQTFKKGLLQQMFV